MHNRDTGGPSGLMPLFVVVVEYVQGRAWSGTPTWNLKRPTSCHSTPADVRDRSPQISFKLRTNPQQHRCKQGPQYSGQIFFKWRTNP